MEAGVNGEKVTRNAHKETGRLPIELAPEGWKIRLFDFLPPFLPVFHWHGDTFFPTP